MRLKACPARDKSSSTGLYGIQKKNLCLTRTYILLGCQTGTQRARELFSNMAVKVDVLIQFGTTLACRKAKEDVILGNHKDVADCHREA